MSSYKTGDEIFPDYFYEEEDNLEEIKNSPPDEIILPANQIFTLYIDYPLTTEFTTELNTGVHGLTRRNVIDFVIKCYKKIYEEEDESTKVKAGHIPNMFNRNKTNGKYGIWGHDLSDLMIHTLYVQGNELRVGVDS